MPRARSRDAASPSGDRSSYTWRLPWLSSSKAMVGSTKIPKAKPMDELLHEVRDGVAYVTFNRPQARNALTFAMYERLAEICDQASAERSIRAILITGGGDKAFAAGTDISQFRAFD